LDYCCEIPFRPVTPHEPSFNFLPQIARLQVRNGCGVDRAVRPTAAEKAAETASRFDQAARRLRSLAPVTLLKTLTLFTVDLLTSDQSIEQLSG
jgi:hypothetical protein